MDLFEILRAFNAGDVETLRARVTPDVNYVIPGRTPPYCRTCGLLTPEQRHGQWRDYVNAPRTATAVPWPPLG